MDYWQLKSEINKIKWWHTIDLGNGLITPGYNDNYQALPLFHLPERLDGLTVLDIGAYDGFYSFEAEKRGAKRVLATDSYVWLGGGGASKAGFDLARKALNSRVEEKLIDVMELSPDKIGTFDLVLFLGVLYHLRHPLLALEKVASVTGRQLILETHINLVDLKKPALAFYPGNELAADPTNWWGPNPAAVEAMLKTVGFSRVEQKELVGDRLICHAWR